MTTLHDHAVENAALFARIADRYDLANDVLSLGLHRRWRQQLLAAVDVRPGERALDAGTGTGEVALALAQRTRCAGDVVGLDPCAPMLARARQKNPAVTWREGDVEALDFADASFDVVTMAWSLRNVGDPLQGLREVRRVLRPGGRLGILEFGAAEEAAFSFYVCRLLPRIGGAVFGDRAAYDWLASSSARFPAGAGVVSWLASAGFRDIKATRLFAGVAWLYVAQPG